MWVYWKEPVFNQTSSLHTVNLKDNSSGHLKGRWLPGASSSSQGSPWAQSGQGREWQLEPIPLFQPESRQPQQWALGTSTGTSRGQAETLGLRIWLNNLVYSNTCSLPWYAGNMHRPSRWIERSELMPLTPCWKVCECLLSDVLSFAYWNKKLSLV